MAILGCVLVGGLCFAAIGFAICSLVVAYSRGQTTALGWAALLVGILALLFWVLTLVDLFEVVDHLIRGRDSARLGSPRPKLRQQ